MSAADAAVAQLGRLAELGMGLVERLHAAAMATEDTLLACQLSDAFCDAGRGVRQSIALRLRIQNGGFAIQRTAPAAETDPDEDPPEREEREERPERGDWYERPDYETLLRLTGDPAVDDPAIAAAVEGAVTRIRKRYAKAEAVLAPTPQRRPAGRAALLAGTAPLRFVDSS